MAQAVATARLGPLAPNTIDTLPAARLRIIPGMKKAEIRLGPRSMNERMVCSSNGSPPIPDPM